MITKEQIKELPRKYAIGKRPLSRVMGWGELTYTRLLEGSMPSPKHEEELLKALNEPLTYMMLLEHAHDSGVISDMSYERSKRAAQSYLEEDKQAEGAMKLNVVGRYFCSLAKGDITPHALQLLVYYAQGRSCASMPDALFDQLPVAQADGPAYDSITTWFTYERICETGRVSPEEYSDVLSAKERKLLDGVFADYGIYSGTKLQELASSEGPWKKARKKSLDAGDDSNLPAISLKSMKKFFAKSAK